MRKLFAAILLALLSIATGYSQIVSTPSSTSFSQNTANQLVTGFSVSGFSASSSLLITIGLVNPPSGTTLRLNTITGVVASTGYNLSSNFTRISFTGTQENVNTVLSSLRMNTGSTPGNVYIVVTATVNPVGYYYLPTNGHFYRPMTWPGGVSGGDAAYLTVKSNAAATSFKGQTGYLVTITNADEQNFIQANVPGSNILFALTDRQQEGVWRVDAGPENGTIIKTANSGGNVAGQYNNWCGGEPNNWGSGENYAVTKWGGGNCWNDFGPPATSFPSSVSGYVIEYGTWADPANQSFSDFFTGFVTHQISCSPATSPSAPIGSGNSRTNAGIVTISASPPAGSTVDWYSSASGGNVLSGGQGTTNFTTPVLTATTTYYAQSRNTSTGCISSARTAVTAVINYPTPFSYSGNIYNSENAGVGNVSIVLETKLKNQSTYSAYQTYATSASGFFSISTNLDTSTYDFRLSISNVPVILPNNIDVTSFSSKLLTQNFTGKDYYRMNVNGNSSLTITDIYLVYQRINGSSWPSNTPNFRLFSQPEWTLISDTTANLSDVYPGFQMINTENLTSGQSSNFYLVRTGKIN